MTLEVKVDRAKCFGHALCYATCPEVFDIDDDGKAQVMLDVVPPGMEDAARRAADNCPERAIQISEMQHDA